MNKGEDEIYSILHSLHINYVKHTHKAVFTVEEANNLQVDIKVLPFPWHQRKGFMKI